MNTLLVRDTTETNGASYGKRIHGRKNPRASIRAWEKDGSPAGQADKYWERARALLEGDLLAAATSPSIAAGSSASADAPEGEPAKTGST